MHKSQVLLLAIGAFALGVLAGSFWLAEPTIILTLLLSAVLIGFIAGYHRTFGSSVSGEKKRKIGLLISFLILVGVLGFWRTSIIREERGILMQFAGNLKITLRGYVDGPINSTKTGANFPLVVQSIAVGNKEIKIDERVLVQTFSAPSAIYGDQIAVRGSLQIPKNFNNFDYVDYLKKQDISLIIKPTEIIPSPISISRPTKIKISIYRRLFLIRSTLEKSNSRSLPEPVASYINGILFGSRQNISQEIQDAFSRTGTSHILAISGYNVTIVAGTILWLLLYFMPRRRAFWVAAILIVLFTIMTGASASVVRAAIMGLVFLAASSYGRLADSANLVFLAAGLMIAQNPLLLRFDIGFQLSFAAVLGLIFIQPIFNYFLRHVPDAGKIKEIVTATLAAQVFVLPLLIYYFNSFSLVFLIVNVLVLPLVPLAMALGFATSVAGLIWIRLGRLVGVLTWSLASYQLGVIQWFSHLKFAAVQVQVSILWICALYALIFGLTFWLIRVINN